MLTELAIWGCHLPTTANPWSLLTSRGLSEHIMASCTLPLWFPLEIGTDWKISVWGLVHKLASPWIKPQTEQKSLPKLSWFRQFWQSCNQCLLEVLWVCHFWTILGIAYEAPKLPGSGIGASGTHLCHFWVTSGALELVLTLPGRPKNQSLNWASSRVLGKGHRGKKSLWAKTHKLEAAKVWPRLWLRFGQVPISDFHQWMNPEPIQFLKM